MGSISQMRQIGAAILSALMSLYYIRYIFQIPYSFMWDNRVSSTQYIKIGPSSRQVSLFISAFLLSLSLSTLFKEREICSDGDRIEQFRLHFM